jgi:hypothetical protein
MKPAIFILLCYLLDVHHLSAQKHPMMLKWGLMPVHEQLLVDQSEILVSEWLGYVASVCDTDWNRNYKRKMRLTQNEERYLTGFRYPDSLLPAREVLESLEWSKILDNKNGYSLYSVHGCNGMQIIPLSTDYVSSREQRQHLGYLLNFPVTGISYAQAQAFCNWRTKLDSLRNHPHGGPHYQFRLPTIDEFNLFNPGLDSQGVRNRKKELIGFNYRNMLVFDSVESYNDLHQGWEYKSDVRGLFAVQGNAAEMTIEQGVACGGSYFHFAIESYRGRLQRYDSPERWLGFRCVAVVLTDDDCYK